MEQLWEALYNYDMELLSNLLDRTPDLDLNEVDSFGRSLLGYAVAYGDAALVQKLSEAGASGDLIYGSDFEIPLYIAVKAGREDIIDILLKYGANVNITVEHSSLLSRAINSREFNPKIVWKLIAAGADVNLITNQLMSMAPLHNAAMYNRVEVIQWLIAAGADPNISTPNRCTPLYYASVCAERGLIEVLLAAGANVNAQNKFGDTGLHVTAGNRMDEKVKILLSYGADPLLRNGQGITALQAATAAASHIVFIK